VFREVPLLNVGVIMMSLALVIAAVVVNVTLGGDHERVLPAEVATKPPWLNTTLLLRPRRECDQEAL
jgi:hypothetical protein